MATELTQTYMVATPEGSATPVAVFGPDSDHVPAWALKQINGDSEESDAEDGYDAMSVKDLKAEIDARNEGRDDEDHLSKTGSKADLIAALEADDK